MTRDNVPPGRIGCLLGDATSDRVQQVTSLAVLPGRRVSQAMSSQCTVVAGDLKLQQLVDRHVLASGQRCFFVDGEGDTIGLITLFQVKEVPSSEWATTSAAEIMVRLEQSRRIDPDTELCEALEEMDRSGVDLLPVSRDQQIVGMVSREDVITFLRTIEELRT